MCDVAYVGQRVCCPLCMQEIAMPAPPAENQGVAVPSGLPDQGGKRGMLLTVVILAGVLVAGVGAWFFARGHAKTPSAAVEAQAKTVQIAPAAPKSVRAEIRTQLSQAAVLVGRGQYIDADKILGSLAAPPDEPTADMLSTYRSVAEWLALHGRWAEAAARYGSLLKMEGFDDWDKATRDYHACAVALAESGDKAGFDQMCQSAISQYGTTDNGDLAGRVIKVCLLLPAKRELMAQIQPLADAANRTFAPSTKVPDWAVIHLSLWCYRHGDYSQAIAWCQRVENRDQGTAIEATTLIVRAMSHFRAGKTAEAQADLVRGRQKLEGKFKADLDPGNAGDGYWYDWALAQILLDEATNLIGKD